MQNKTPKVSVVMSTFNDELTIENSVKSILEQTYTNYEFLIMDDCSTDNTCLLYTSPSPRDATLSRMPSSA